MDLQQYFNIDFNGKPREPGAWDIGAYKFAPDLDLHGTPSNKTIYLNWIVNITIPETLIWYIKYYA